ncbi:hypothetical protein [Streptomyces lydicus]|uniref:hypothetical protein n=1 Tax=Streptomyces lydicus TaxID=47763 RepID=UPI0010106B9A|nr:hypothetical protein [Streptomyces lydicus]MCZ1011980.1 hypothetical protein [Streptomyces lydicus]
MFETHESLHEALTTSGTFNGLYTALVASTPPLATRAHANLHTGEHVTGLNLFEQHPHTRNSPISGSITINPKTGAITLRTDGYPGPRWHAAADRLTTDTNPWSWQPAPEHKPGTLAGVLHLGAHITAETTIDRSSHHADTANTALTLTPAHREACDTAWALAVMVLGTLVTNDPAYSSTVLPTPSPDTLTHPATDYQAAADIVAKSLERIDENPDFGLARDNDPNWPTGQERIAVLGLRDFRDDLIHAANQQPTPRPSDYNYSDEPPF